MKRFEVWGRWLSGSGLGTKWEMVLISEDDAAMRAKLRKSKYSFRRRFLNENEAVKHMQENS